MINFLMRHYFFMIILVGICWRQEAKTASEKQLWAPRVVPEPEGRLSADAVLYASHCKGELILFLRHIYSRKEKKTLRIAGVFFFRIPLCAYEGERKSPKLCAAIKLQPSSFRL
jgi:hypothetical protein